MAKPEYPRHPTKWFVRCACDGFIDWSKPYGQFARALLEAEMLDAKEHGCGPHTVVAREWVIKDVTE